MGCMEEERNQREGDIKSDSQMSNLQKWMNVDTTH